MGLMPTAYTGEFGLALSVAFRYMAAAVAGPRGVAWVYEHHRDASSLRLVADERSELSKTPVVLSCPLPFSNRHPVAYPGQIFQNNRGLRVFGVLNKTLGDAVVYPSLKARLFARHAFEATLGAFAARRLIGLARRVAPFALGFNGLARVGVAIGVGGQVDDAQIDANKPFRVYRRLLRRLHRHQQIKLPISEDEIGLPLAPVELHPLVVAHLHGNQNATAKRCQTGEFQPLKRQDALIVDDRAMGLKRDATPLVPLVGFDDFGDGANGQLSRQVKPRANVIVDGLLQLELREHALAEGVGGNPRTGVIECQHRVGKRLMLLI